MSKYTTFNTAQMRSTEGDYSHVLMARGWRTLYGLHSRTVNDQGLCEVGLVVSRGGGAP